VSDLTPTQAHHEWSSGRAAIVDVREPVEYETTHVEGIPLLPMSEFMERIDELPDGPLIIMCRSGRRSAQIADYLNANGEHGEVANLEGGIIQWAAEGLPYEGAPPS